eukprot:TRINITY_DN30673_c0_g1_i1.p1 TRINITY_DN30673_c0_g1~~TRINITY_DN30673_c0_g1_i1.p1  ORF type:complete len:361 (+),score=70.36 TRINITY_DN30673_c0_g1_i1:50-1132(+)
MNFHDDDSDDSSDDLDEFLRQEVEAPPAPLAPQPVTVPPPLPIPAPVAPLPVAAPPQPAPIATSAPPLPMPSANTNPSMMTGLELLQHPGLLPKRPKGDPPKGFPPLETLLCGFVAMLPPGTPLPEGLVEEKEPEEEEKPTKPKKQRFRQIGDWTEFVNEQGKMYYQNMVTRAVQWDVPKVFGGSDWVEYKTAENEAYYYNVSTKETVWDRPAEMKQADKPSFIKEIEANEKKRKRSEKAKEQGVQAQAPVVSQVQSFVLPMTEVEIRQKNIRERELRHKRLQEKKRREGQDTAYMTVPEREREAKRNERKSATRERETRLMQQLKEQADKRKQTGTAAVQSIDVDCDSVSSPVEISDSD